MKFITKAEKISSPFFVLNLLNGGKETEKKIIGPKCTEKSF